MHTFTIINERTGSIHNSYILILVFYNHLSTTLHSIKFYVLCFSTLKTHRK